MPRRSSRKARSRRQSRPTSRRKRASSRKSSRRLSRRKSAAKKSSRRRSSSSRKSSRRRSRKQSGGSSCDKCDKLKELLNKNRKIYSTEKAKNKIKTGFVKIFHNVGDEESTIKFITSLIENYPIYYALTQNLIKEKYYDKFVYNGRTTQKDRDDAIEKYNNAVNLFTDLPDKKKVEIINKLKCFSNPECKL